ncbi:hypothetical protein Bca4012_019683 [Brassica carinata]
MSHLGAVAAFPIFPPKNSNLSVCWFLSLMSLSSSGKRYPPRAPPLQCNGNREDGRPWIRTEAEDATYFISTIFQGADWMSTSRLNVTKFQSSDIALWKLCAGSLFDLPIIGEQVYYFPQGHIEEVETNTDEVYAKISLLPCSPDMSQLTPSQEIVAKDLHDHVWKFKHTFREERMGNRELESEKQVLNKVTYHHQ